MGWNVSRTGDNTVWRFIAFYLGVRCPRCQEQRSDTGYEETGHRGLGFIFSSIRSVHFMLAR
jgi:hypothetical protein